MTGPIMISCGGTIGDPMPRSRAVTEATFVALSDLRLLSSDGDTAISSLAFDRRSAELCAGVEGGPCYAAFVAMRKAENADFNARREFVTFKPVTEEQLVERARKLRAAYDAVESMKTPYDKEIVASYRRRVQVTPESRAELAKQLHFVDDVVALLEKAMLQLNHAKFMADPGRGRRNKRDVALLAAAQETTRGMDVLFGAMDKFASASRPLSRRLQRELAAAKAPPAPPAPPADETPEEPPQVH